MDTCQLMIKHLLEALHNHDNTDIFWYLITCLPLLIAFYEAIISTEHKLPFHYPPCMSLKLNFNVE